MSKFKLVPFIFLLLCFLASCEKDVINDELVNYDQESNVIIEEISFKDFDDKPLLEEFYTKTKNSNTTLFRSEKDDLYDFSIDSSRIRKIITGQNVSYTFIVKRKKFNIDIFENLVLVKPKEGKEIKAFLLEYDTEKATKIDSHKSFSYDGTPKITPLTQIDRLNLARQVQICYTIYTTYCTHEYLHIAGPACLAADDGRTYSTATTNCVYLDGSAFGETDSGGKPGPGGGGDGSDNEPGFDVSGMSDRTIEFKEFTKFSLNSTQRQYFFDLTESKKWDIFIYLDSNGFDEGSKDFAAAAIQAWKDEGEVDFENELIFTEAFKNTKAYCVLQALMEIDNDLFRKTISQFTSNNATLPLIFDDSPITNMDFNGTITNDNSTEAETHYDDSINIAVITFNTNNNSANGNPLEIAGNLLHEAIHAELFAIISSNNNVPFPIPQDQYNYMVNLLEYWSNNGLSNFVMSNSQHTFMVYNHVKAIAEAVQSFDNDAHPLENYMSFGWSGLSQIGIDASLLTQSDMNNFIYLSQIPLNNGSNNSCD